MLGLLMGILLWILMRDPATNLMQMWPKYFIFKYDEFHGVLIWILMGVLLWIYCGCSPNFKYDEFHGVLLSILIGDRAMTTKGGFIFNIQI